jgi:hypothetical protein
MGRKSPDQTWSFVSLLPKRVSQTSSTTYKKVDLCRCNLGYGGPGCMCGNLTTQEEKFYHERDSNPGLPNRKKKAWSLDDLKACCRKEFHKHLLQRIKIVKKYSSIMGGIRTRALLITRKSPNQTWSFVSLLQKRVSQTSSTTYKKSWFLQMQPGLRGTRLQRVCGTAWM